MGADEDTQLIWETLASWVPGLLALIGVIGVAIIGYIGAARRAEEARTNPAYAELLKSDESKTERLDKLEDLVDALRAERRALEDKLDAQDDRIDTLSRDLDAERDARMRLQRQVDWFKALTEGDRAWIRRTIDRIHTGHPTAWGALLPLPDHITDPGLPAIQRDTIPDPPDDGQPGDVTHP